MTAYQWPFREPWKCTLAYGVKGKSWKAGYHSGMDFVSKAAGGDGNVLPVAPGKVLRATRYHASYGNYVTVLHDDGHISLYAHMDSLNVKEGQAVSYDTVLGIEGSTGNVTGRHLHLEVHKGAYFYPSHIDPRAHITPRLQSGTGQAKEDTIVYHYHKLPKMYAVRIDPRDWRIIKWCKGKRTTTIKNYCCFPFQATGTVPVGNIIADGVKLAENPRLSTIWATADGKVDVGFTPPAGVKTAVSGIPLIVKGKEFTIDEAMAQGWDKSPLYATTHSLLGIGGDGNLYYYVFSSTAKTVAATWEELLDTARSLGCHTVLLGDGGGSTILDIEGSNAVASTGNRVLAALMQF